MIAIHHGGVLHFITARWCVVFIIVGWELAPLAPLGTAVRYMDIELRRRRGAPEFHQRRKVWYMHMRACRGGKKKQYYKETNTYSKKLVQMSRAPTPLSSLKNGNIFKAANKLYWGFSEAHMVVVPIHIPVWSGTPPVVPRAQALLARTARSTSGAISSTSLGFFSASTDAGDDVTTTVTATPTGAGRVSLIARCRRR